MSGMEDDSYSPLMTTGEVAALFRVDPKTVTTWASQGLIRSIRTPGGSRRFREEDVQALLNETSGRAPSSPPLDAAGPGQEQGPAPSHDAGPPA